VALASSQACQWFVILAITLPLHAQDKKEDKKKDTPKITCVTPLAVIPGVTKTLKLRGLSLADATAVKLTTAAGDPIPATIKSKTKSDPPKPFDAPKAGDSEAQIELTLPPATKPADLPLILTTPAGDTAPFKLPLADPATTIEEKEPNGGFKRRVQPKNLYFATMAGYEEGLPVHVIFDKPEKMVNILGHVLADHGITQFRSAETEKFPHVTFFFDDTPSRGKSIPTRWRASARLKAKTSAAPRAAKTSRPTTWRPRCLRLRCATLY